MTDSGNIYVKKTTMLISVAVALAVGFISGVVYGVYKTGKGTPGQHMPVDQRQVADVDRAAKGNAEKIKSLEDKAKQSPGDAEAWINLGNICFDSGLHEKAINAYNKALEITPGSADILTDLGVMYRRAGQPKKAIESFDKAIASDSKHEHARFNKGVVLMHDLNDQEGAIKAWKELVEVNPMAATPSGMFVDELVKRFSKKK
jgi:cytochrome c-type biogenesis protein CcmH/NrfG